MSFESLPDTRDNHFNLLRLVAAGTVIAAHSYPLTRGPLALDPLGTWTGFDSGTTAVLAFFAISGFFISLSFDRRRSNAAFILARMTRILPGLLIVSVLTAFIVGPLFTALPAKAYFGDIAVWAYVPETLSIVRIMAAKLPQMFTHNAYPAIVNGSLWTLFYEAACYAALFAAGLLNWLRSDRLQWLVLAWLPLYVFARYGPFRTFIMPRSSASPSCWA